MMSVESMLVAATGSVWLATAPRWPLRWRFCAAMLLAVPQLYVIPVGEIYLSLGLLSSYLLWPEFVKESRALLREPALVILLALLFAQIVSWEWSPDLRLGLRTLIYSLPFLFIVCAAFAVVRMDRRAFDSVLIAACALMLIEAVLVIAFRLSPVLEVAYLDSYAAGILGGPNVVAGLIDGSARNNVLDPAKAGGMFVNANVAAGYLGIGAFIAYRIARLRRSALLRLVALPLWIAVFFTGSKAGMMLAVALPIVVMVAYRVARLNANARRALQLGAAVAAVLAVMSLPMAAGWIGQLSGFTADVVAASEIRVLLWSHAARAFAESPLLGQGFGGWEAGFAGFAATFDIGVSQPPHNTLVYLWSQSGLPAAILACLFIAAVVRVAQRLLRQADPAAQHAGTVLLLVGGWIFLHGMGTNSGLLGEVHEMPLFAAVLGAAYAARRPELGFAPVRPLAWAA